MVCWGTVSQGVVVRELARRVSLRSGAARLGRALVW